MLHVHTKERDRMCQFCGKTFVYACNLKLHEQYCQGNKPYPCPECGKHFATRDMVRKHKLTHTDEFAYPCEVCGKRFSRQDNLKIHLRIHTGDKPFACATCGQKFRVKCTLKTHEASAHGTSVRVARPRPTPSSSRRRNPTDQGAKVTGSKHAPTVHQSNVNVQTKETESFHLEHVATTQNPEEQPGHQVLPETDQNTVAINVVSGGSSTQENDSCQVAQPVIEHLPPYNMMRIAQSQSQSNCSSVPENYLQFQMRQGHYFYNN